MRVECLRGARQRPHPEGEDEDEEEKVGGARQVVAGSLAVSKGEIGQFFVF